MHQSGGGAWSGRFRLGTTGAGLGVLVLGGALIVLGCVKTRKAHSTPAAPQSETNATAGQPAPVKPDPPGTIDGARNPELIPDEVALRMIVLSVEEPANATEAQMERLRAKLSPIGLSEEDIIALQILFGEFRTQVDELNRQTDEVRVRAPIPHPASTDYKLLVELGKQRNQCITDTVAALPAKLSLEGYQKLLDYLPTVKKGIKYLPDKSRRGSK